MFSNRHLSDEVLILSMDADLPPRRLVQARRHLARCAACQARVDHLERTLADATDLLRTQDATANASHSDARARLQSRVAACAADHAVGHSDWSIPEFARAHGPLAACAAATAALCIVALSFIGHTPAQADGVYLLPRADLTPGAAIPATMDELCGPGPTRTAEPIEIRVHREVFASYGANFDRAAEYELDHLITPELGGAGAARNLWPQPFGRTPWNAYVKDELEALFHQRVCDGTLDLATAQREIAGDWIAAYKRYFKTEQPLRDYMQSPLAAGDVEFLVAELAELGITAPARASGPALLAMLHSAQRERQRELTGPPTRLPALLMAALIPGTRR